MVLIRAMFFVLIRRSFMVKICGKLRNVLFLCLSLLLTNSCRSIPISVSSQVKSTEAKLNSPEAILKPYVLMILIDGYRYDYNQIFQPKNLLAFEKSGSGAKALIPVFPSKTFPNHYAIMTGLYAENHEIVSNQFMDPQDLKKFKMGESDSAKNERWYQGLPLWYVAEKNGMKSACYFWVGCEIEKSGVRPSYFETFSDAPTNKERVQKVIRWLELPESVRPHLLTLYFSSVDTAAHRFGTQSPDVKSAIADVDEALGELFLGLEKLKLPVNTIIVSDHGMQDVESNKTIFIDDVFDLSAFEVIGRGPLMQLYLKKGFPESEVQKLIMAWDKVSKKGADKSGSLKFKVFARGQIPKTYHYSKTPKVGDIIIEAKNPYSLVLRQDKVTAFNKITGNHGYNPTESSMWGIFYVQGPAFKNGVILNPIVNVDIYPMVLKILQLPSDSSIDGKLINTQTLIK